MRIYVWAFCALMAALSTVAQAQMRETEPEDAAPPLRDLAELRLTSVQRQLAFDVARVAMNEAGGAEADMALIMQVLRAQASTERGMVSFLRRHSPCATGVLPQSVAERRPGNCRWTRNLWPRQHSAPQGFPEGTAWRPVRERWYAALRMAAEFVTGRRVLIVCAEAPVSWDGARWRDDIIERGFEILDCKGTRNVGVRRARPAGRQLDRVSPPARETGVAAPPLQS